MQVQRPSSEFLGHRPGVDLADRDQGEGKAGSADRMVVPVGRWKCCSPSGKAAEVTCSGKAGRASGFPQLWEGSSS